MPIRACTAACAAVGSVAVAVPGAAGGALTRSRGQISFAPDSDDGSFDIRARGGHQVRAILTGAPS